MALDVNERIVAGFVRWNNGQSTYGPLSTTINTTGATVQAGFLRDPDGRLVVSNG